MSIKEEIERAAEFGEKFEELVVARKECPAGDRNMLLIGYWSLIFDCHKGILSLLANEFYGSAFALVRPTLEALVRSHVVLMGSEEDVQRIKKDEYSVNFKTIGAQIDAAFGYGTLLQKLLDAALKALHSFTHSGISQLGRRFEGNDLKLAYFDEEIIEVIRTTTSAVYLVTRLVTMHFKFEEEAKAAEELFLQWGKRS
ncbi:MAG TPA: hypothetical protein VK738_01335 [Terriglobales bacterium]|nr:hypothetical protein [Terriglobales bacterium]